MERFDVIVVGAGPAGNAAAYTLAKAGLSVLQLERGETPGTKNVQGAILYAHALEEIIPDFRTSAPLERHVIEQRMWLMDENDSCMSVNYRDARFNVDAPNRYTIFRARFDRWFSGKVKEAGALVICETTVIGLLHDKVGKVIGVKTEREQGDIYADCVILADGANSLVGTNAGIRPKIRVENMALAVKEVLFLPKATIEERFGITGNEGAVTEIAGNITYGMAGTGFLYTNKDSISIGIGCMLSDMKGQNIPPYSMLEGLKQHPSIKPLIAGSEMKEYSAHLMPEGGLQALPPLYGDGWMIVGDSAGFLNSVHREGSNLAMMSGRIAAQSLIALRNVGKPCTASHLVEYQRRLDESLIMADLKKYRHIPDFLDNYSDRFLSLYPRLISEAAREMLTVDALSKREKQKKIMSQFKSRRSLLGMLGDAYRFWRAFR